MKKNDLVYSIDKNATFRFGYVTKVNEKSCEFFDVNDKNIHSGDKGEVHRLLAPWKFIPAINTVLGNFNQYLTSKFVWFVKNGTFHIGSPTNETKPFENPINVFSFVDGAYHQVGYDQIHFVSSMYSFKEVVCSYGKHVQ